MIIADLLRAVVRTGFLLVAPAGSNVAGVRADSFAAGILGFLRAGKDRPRFPSIVSDRELLAANAIARLRGP